MKEATHLVPQMEPGWVSGSPKHFTQKHGQCQEMALHDFFEPSANLKGDFYFNAAFFHFCAILN